jgi:hypothetical protein
MQLINNKKIKLSIATALVCSSLSAEDVVSFQILNYSENNDRIDVIAPSLAFEKDFGVDYTLNVDIVGDSVSGATPTWKDVDSTSGASKLSKSGDYVYDKVEMDDDNRLALSTSLLIRDENRDETTFGVAYSTESDFRSYEASINHLKYLDESHNKSISVGFSYQKNDLLDYDAISGASSTESFDKISLEAGFTQIIDKDSIIKPSIFYSYEDGFLDNPYLRVIKNINGVEELIKEHRPDTKAIYGVSTKYIRSLSKNLIIHSDYRFYHNNWDINSHTIDNSLYYTLNDKITLIPSFRYYMQSEASFYSDKAFSSSSKEYSSDYRLSDFDSTHTGLRVEYKYSSELSFNFSTSFYSQSTGLDATMISSGFEYKY